MTKNSTDPEIEKKVPLTEEKKNTLSDDQHVIVTSVETLVKRYPYLISATELTDLVNGTAEIRLKVSQNP